MAYVVAYMLAAAAQSFARHPCGIACLRVVGYRLQLQREKESLTRNARELNRLLSTQRDLQARRSMQGCMHTSTIVHA